MNEIEIPESFKGTFEGCSGWKSHAPVFKKVLDVVKPSNILEVGFFRGSSSYMWLHLSNANVTSVDPLCDVEYPLAPRKYDGAPENVDKLKELFPNRFNFFQLDSKFVYPFIKDNKYDLMFIDGGHLSEAVRNDLNLAVKLKVPYILLDDFINEVLWVYNSEFYSLYDIIEVFGTTILDTGIVNKICFAKLKYI